MTTESQYKTSLTAEETEAMGAAFAAQLRGGDVVTLRGDLGSGKTVFARGIARGLGIDEPVTSPTFAIVQEYKGATWRLNHIDLYRLLGWEDALSFGIEDILRDQQSITVVEWPERISELLGDTFDVSIEPIDAQRRQLRFNPSGPFVVG